MIQIHRILTSSLMKKLFILVLQIRISTRKTCQTEPGVTVVDKNNLNNPKQKSSRSLILVDFGLYGFCYVHKNVLQFTSDYSDCLETLCEKQGTTDGDQSSRNKVRSDKRSKFRDAKYQQTLENREKRKQFREWRKDPSLIKKN